MTIPKIFKNTVRTHDHFYVHDGPDKEVKEFFKLIVKLIHQRTQSGKLNNDFSLLDAGCAAGVFLNYVNTQFPNSNLQGLEVLDVLVEKARSNFPQLTFSHGSIFDRHRFKKQQFDIVTLLGVLSIFDEPKAGIQNCVEWLKPGGQLIIFGMFNQYDNDIYVKYRAVGSSDPDSLESGWNIMSEKTMTAICEALNCEVAFVPFQINVDLEKHPTDSVRSWTETRQDGSKYITNGLCLMQPHQICIITKR